MIAIILGEENSPSMFIATGFVDNTFLGYGRPSKIHHVISRKDLKGHHRRLFYKLNLEILVYIVKFIS